MSFGDEFDKALRENLAYAKNVRNTEVVALGTKIILDTPVLTGDLRGSWRSTTGVPSEDKEARRDPTGALPIAELEAAVKQWPDEGSLFMANNLRHSEGVEFDSWSHQKPAGMVRVNIVGREGFADLHTGTGRAE